MTEQKLNAKKDLEEMQNEELKYRLKFERYVYENGLSNSCYIQREQGDEVSLMTELVTSNKKKDLFKREAKMLKKFESTDVVRLSNSQASSIELEK